MKEIDYMMVVISKKEGITAFEEEIKRHQREGWSCIGSFFENEIVYRREMVKYEKIICDDIATLPDMKISLVPPKPKREKKPVDPLHMSIARQLADNILKVSDAKITEGKIAEWGKEVRLMVELDNRSPESIRVMIENIFRNHTATGFSWSKVIRSMGTLRKRWNEGKLSNLSPNEKGKVPIW